MKSDYHQTIYLTLLFTVICFLSLIFATGKGIGISFDDNQLVAYLLSGISLFICLSAFKVKLSRKRKTMVKTLGTVHSLFLILFFSGWIGFNEGLFIFIVPIIGASYFSFVTIIHYLEFNN